MAGSAPAAPHQPDAPARPGFALELRAAPWWYNVLEGNGWSPSTGRPDLGRLPPSLLAQGHQPDAPARQLNQGNAALSPALKTPENFVLHHHDRSLVVTQK